jgi:hypothetical protein
VALEVGAGDRRGVGIGAESCPVCQVMIDDATKGRRQGGRRRSRSATSMHILEALEERDVHRFDTPPIES